MEQSGRPAVDAQKSGDRGSVVAIGFGTTVCMWAVGYLGRLPFVEAPAWLLFVLMLACLAAGGITAGRYATWRTGLWAGTLSAALNLLILGSLLGGGRPNQLNPSAVWWIGGSILLGTALAGLGGAIGGLRPAARASRPNWTAVLAFMACFAALLLIIAGGLVTSNRAGLAVVDWPNSFGYNMFLYPLARMTGGIYYEHAHRLLGSLVGLTTLVLAIHLHMVDSRRWLRRFALAVLIAEREEGGDGKHREQHCDEPPGVDRSELPSLDDDGRNGEKCQTRQAEPAPVRVERLNRIDP